MFNLNLSTKKGKIVLLITFIFLLNCLSFVFAVKSTEANVIFNTEAKLKSSHISSVFDGLYVKHNITIYGHTFPSNFTYSHYSGDLYNESWSVEGEGTSIWLVDIETRIMSGGSAFEDGNHTPAWIFTDIKLGKTIPISVDGEGDHSFKVANQTIYGLPGFGLVEIWVLEDLTLPGGIAWYEKSTGILLNGTFFFSGGAANYTFDFIDTNAIFKLLSISGPVAIFRNVLPWDLNVTEPILNMYNIDYTVYSSADMGTVDLSPFEKVIIESDQDQLFYNTLGTNISWFENYATNGGILEIHACDNGWNGGTWDGLYLMPGGINQTHVSSDNITINLTSHPILLYPNIITDAELDDWDSSAHGSFNTYPENSKEILLDGNTLNPVFIELDYGEGTILITMQTLEFGYDNGYSNFLENVILYDPDIMKAPSNGGFISGYNLYLLTGIICVISLFLITNRYKKFK